MIHRVPRSQEVKSLPKKQQWPRLQKNKTCNTSESGSAMTSTSGCNEGRFLDRPLSWHPSPPLFFYSSLYPPFLWRPSGPHQGSVCSSHMWGVSAYPTRINQPLNVRIFVYVLIPAPPKPSFSLSHLLVPYRRELVPFTALPSPLERTSQGPNSAILCLIAPAPPWRTVPSKNLWRHGRKWTGFVLSLDI